MKKIQQIIIMLAVLTFAAAGNPPLLFPYRPSNAAFLVLRLQTIKSMLRKLH